MHNISKQIIIKSDNLPLYCNGKAVSVSYKDIDTHPKIYLPIEQQPILSCPYCGIEYILS